MYRVESSDTVESGRPVHPVEHDGGEVPLMAVTVFAPNAIWFEVKVSVKGTAPARWSICVDIWPPIEKLYAVRPVKVEKGPGAPGIA